MGSKGRRYRRTHRCSGVAVPSRRTCWWMSSRHRWGVAGHHRPARTRPRCRTGVTLSGQSSAALVPRTSGPGRWPSPQPSCCSAPRSLGTGRPRRGRAGGRAALQVDGEELTAGRRSPCGPGPASTGRRRPAPHRRGRPDCPRPDRAGPHHPHPRAGVGGDGGPEPNRPSRSRDVAPVDSGAGGRQSGGTWAVQPRQPVLRVLRLGVAPPGRSQVRQYRPQGSGRGAPASRPRKARPAPAVTERTWSEMSTGRGGGRPRS